MANQRKLSIRVPMPKAKASGLRLFPRAPQAPKPPGLSKPGKFYKKDQLQQDPMKFGNFGFDLNMQAPSIVQRGSK